MTEESSTKLSADKPLEDPEQDLLGYADFAEHLAKSIVKMTPPEGLVIGLYGAWGSGKTTLINFVLHHLSKLPESQIPTTVRFNPWWFSGQEELLARFFQELQAGISQWRGQAASVLGKLGDLFGRMAKTPIVETILESNLMGAKVAVELAGELVAPKKQVAEIKEDLAKELKKRGKRILVIIDDIDRLTREEIRQLFGVIKGVADFPNMLYILAFDRDVVVEALGGAQGKDGQKFLEKIVQVPFPLPLARMNALERLFEDRVFKIVDRSATLWEQDRWSDIFEDGLLPFFSTPRDVVRLANALQVTYAAIDGEVNPVDFIALEALRLFRPDLWRWISLEPHMFAGDSLEERVEGNPLRRPNNEDLKRFHERWIEQEEDGQESHVAELLKTIFPRFASAYKGTAYGPTDIETFGVHCRACHPDQLFTYFRLAIDLDAISRRELDEVLGKAVNPPELFDKFNKLGREKVEGGKTRLHLLIHKLIYMDRDKLSIEQVEGITKCLTDFSFNSEIGTPAHQIPPLVDLFIRLLLNHFHDSQRAAKVMKAINKGSALAVLEVVNTFDMNHGKPIKYLRDDEIDMIKKEACERFQQLAEQDSIKRESLGIDILLFRWAQWGGEQEAKRWAQQISETDGGLLRLVEEFFQLDNVRNLREARMPNRICKLFDDLARFLDLPDTMKRLRTLQTSESLPQEQKELIDLVVDEYEKREQSLSRGVGGD